MQAGCGTQMQVAAIFIQQKNGAQYFGILILNAIHNASQRLGKRCTSRDVR
jgi:hypothetical protein